jgi:hypothetical protein
MNHSETEAFRDVERLFAEYRRRGILLDANLTVLLLVGLIAPRYIRINLDPAGRFAFAADLGLDEIRAYRFDRSTGSLLPHDPSAARVAPGSGPRHLAFHPDGGQSASGWSLRTSYS